ncbi:MAG TPA: phosphatase PAP2 family protein [Pseudomonadales bacterium]|nr:phosphatase PAP2 family protein [Pseudomonadales bacterium]
MSCEKNILPISSASQPFNMKMALGIPLFIMIILALFEPSRLDLWLADMMYQPGIGFIGAKSFFLEDILHDRAKEAVIAIALIIFATWLASFAFPNKIKIERKRLLYVVVAMVIASSVITPLKKLTEVHCPWSLDRYGGVEIYSSVMDKRAAPVEKAGQCWPGGHASSGFILFALFFALRDIRPRAARVALIFALVLGVTFSVSRMLQGAHFLSHNVWTALIDWLVCTLLYGLMLYRPAVQECPSQEYSAREYSDQTVSARMDTPHKS